MVGPLGELLGMSSQFMSSGNEEKVCPVPMRHVSLNSPVAGDYELALWAIGETFI